MAWNVTGSLVALVTPFAADGSVDFDALGALIDFHLANHTDGLVVLGTTGESSTMTHEEDAAVCDYTVKRVFLSSRAVLPTLPKQCWKKASCLKSWVQMACC